MFFFGDASEDKSISNDKSLSDQIHTVNEGIPKLIEHLKKINPKRIVFNGKTAASCFFEFLKKGKVDKLKPSFINELNYSYGKIENWNGIEIWMLPNLSNAAGNSWKNDRGEDRWLSFWKTIASNKAPIKKTKPWIWLLVALVVIITILIFTKK